MLSRHFIESFARELGESVIERFIQNDDLVKDMDNLYSEYWKQLNLIFQTSAMSILLKYIKAQKFKTYDGYTIFKEVLDEIFTNYTDAHFSFAKSRKVKRSNVVFNVA